MEKRDHGGGSSGKRKAEKDGLDDWEEEFRLPRGHRPVENLDTEGLEQASVDTRLGASNVGFRLLQKMGWKGKGLGKNEQGILEPIKAGMRDAKLGVGKQEQDDFFTAEDNVQRKRLNVELEETEEHVKKREVTAEREQKIRSEVKEIQKTFFCSLCNKQYKLALEFETHLSSYDHNHRKRFKEMREMQNSSNSNRDDRQKREQQREEKELAKFATLADAHRKQQQQKQEQPEISGEQVTPQNLPTAGNQDQRRTLKFGFSIMAPSKAPVGNISKKPKIATKVPSVFGNDSDDEAANAHTKQEQQKQEQPGISGAQGTPKNLSTAGNQDQRRTLKFGFSKMTPSKAPIGSISKKPKITTKVPSVFGNDSDEEA